VTTVIHPILRVLSPLIPAKTLVPNNRRTGVEHVVGMPWRETTNSAWNTPTPPLAALRPGCGAKTGALCVIPMEIWAVPMAGNHHGEKLTWVSARSQTEPPRRARCRILPGHRLFRARAVLVTRRGDRARRVPERAQRRWTSVEQVAGKPAAV
jgi:hypothetical protein